MKRLLESMLSVVPELLFIVRDWIALMMSPLLIVTVYALFGLRLGSLTVSPALGMEPPLQCEGSDQSPPKFEPLACQVSSAITAAYAAAPAGVSGIRALVAPGRTLRFQHPPRAAAPISPAADATSTPVALASASTKPSPRSPWPVSQLHRNRSPPRSPCPRCARSAACVPIVSIDSAPAPNNTSPARHAR